MEKFWINIWNHPIWVLMVQSSTLVSLGPTPVLSSWVKPNEPNKQQPGKQQQTACSVACKARQSEFFLRPSYVRANVKQPFRRLNKGDRGDEAWHWSWNGLANDWARWHQSVPPGKVEEPDQSMAVAFLEFFFNVSVFLKKKWFWLSTGIIRLHNDIFLCPNIWIRLLSHHVYYGYTCFLKVN